MTILYDGDSAGIKAALRGLDMMLEEGVNVKVVLLPEGEDPDSFARKHDATEVLAYIQQHQTDFIRFKTQLLSAEAGNDPMKRADMIAQIVISIATIPDVVKRQIHTKDCATFLHIQEDVLMHKINEVRKNYIEEQKKKRQNEERITNVSEAIETIKDTEKILAKSISNVLSPATSIKELNIRNLLQVIIRHGEKPIFQNGDTTIRAGEYIIQESATFLLLDSQVTV